METKETATHAEVVEGDLENVAGGGITYIDRDRYDPAVCSSIKEVTLKCLGSYTTSATWCKHYRYTDHGIGRTGPKIQHKCEKGCYNYIARE